MGGVCCSSDNHEVVKESDKCRNGETVMNVGYNEPNQDVA